MSLMKPDLRSEQNKVQMKYETIWVENCLRCCSGRAGVSLRRNRQELGQPSAFLAASLKSTSRAELDQACESRSPTAATRGTQTLEERLHSIGDENLICRVLVFEPIAALGQIRLLTGRLGHRSSRC